eukprot:GHVH01003620.1.p1 GENE.GHVH01003620.1~~GHVH01003620.1.p1  ORF type:complete len:443 (+),score=34.84 GHVH01003620.1:159-1331(+)
MAVVTGNDDEPPATEIIDSQPKVNGGREEIENNEQEVIQEEKSFINDLKNASEVQLNVFMIYLSLFIHLGAIFLDIRDIDHDIVVGAVERMLLGVSPYWMPTYRYSGFVALIFSPTVFLGKYWGRLLNSVANVFIFMRIRPMVIDHYSGYSTKLITWICAVTWLFNPFVIAMAARGSMDSIVMALVVESYYHLHWNLRSGADMSRVVVSAICYGTAVHIRIVPILIAPSFFTLLTCTKSPSSRRLSTYDYIKDLFSRILSLDLLQWAVPFMCTVLFWTLLQWRLWGYEGMYEYFLYHLERIDHRHNLSALFIGQYCHFTGDPQEALLAKLASVTCEKLRSYCSLTCQINWPKVYRSLRSPSFSYPATTFQDKQGSTIILWQAGLCLQWLV